MRLACVGIAVAVLGGFVLGTALYNLINRTFRT